MVQKKINFFKKKFLLSKYIKSFIKQGKKEKTELLLKLSFSFIKKTKKLNPLTILLDFLKKARPFCEVKSLKIKGSIQRIPVEIKQSRQKSLLLRWLVTNTHTENTIVEFLSKELLDTTNLQSKTIKLCDEMHKIAEANKIFTQFKN
jgi:small subunit ribosomal protein S7